MFLASSHNRTASTSQVPFSLSPHYIILITAHKISALQKSWLFPIQIHSPASSSSPFSSLCSTAIPVQLNRTPTKEKLSHLRLYWHDVVSGRNPTSIRVVKSSAQHGFGQISMIDNPLTLGPEPSSGVLGKAQGFYVLASQEEVGLLMTMNFVFTRGKYNESSITILGRNAVFDKVREMPIIGGTGLFRFGRGYAEARTNKFDVMTGDATVEYNVYAMHY